MEFLYQSFFLWFIWPVIIGVAIYRYFTKNYDYWEKRGVVSAPAVFMLGSIYGALHRPMQDIEIERYKKLGRIYGHYEGINAVLNVAEPDLLRSILVKDFQYFVNRRKLIVGDPINDNMLTVLDGEDWKRVRTIITPTFTTGKIRRMMNIFTDSAETLCGNFRAATQEGKSVDVKRLYGAFTMDVIASSAFSTKIDSHNDPNNQFVTIARGVFSRNMPWRFIFFFMFPTIMRYLKLSMFSPKAMKFFKDVTLQIIEERKRTGQVRNDFLQLMMDTAKETVEKEEITKDEKGEIDSNYSTEENNDFFVKNLQKKSLSYDEIVAQSVIFFLAGFDTTASTLSFTSYSLALNPDIQDKLVREIDEAVTEAGGKITYEAIQSMKYLDNVISETLRIFPPAIRMERRTEEDYKLGETGITIPKGMLVGIPIYAMHRDPEFFPDPEKFDPERFSPEEKAKRSPYVYLPFGAGPRNCVGMRFALMEIKVCLAYVLSHFRIRRCPETKVPLEFFRGAGLLAPKAVNVKMEIRTDMVLKK